MRSDNVSGVRRDRVAELIVTTPDGRQRGSGYRVTSDIVLTAAHVLQNAQSVVVRFSPDLPDEKTVTATAWWTGSSDLALVSIPGEPVEPVLFGRVGDRAAVIPVEAVGFPLWKFREDYRDSFHATGTVAVLSNWRSGTLEFSLSPAPDAPWNGMSGAALWSGDRIVGVITQHHPGDGPARLAATRIDQALLDRLGVQVWPDVIRDAPADRVLSAYREQLSETAPSILLDRESDLDELVRFCAGSSPYLWLQAGPWAGKSALLSSFVLSYLPRGVDVVSFFITSRFAGQSDSDAFTESMIEQFAALVDEPASGLIQSPARRGHMTRLLREAAERSAEAGRRLLVVVDGLDEDTGRSSIAALLPASVPAAVRVLVASRPHPGLPEDVPADHPLRTLTPRPLTGSPHARDIAVRAKHELRAALHGSDHERTVLGLITAAGGGLTRADIEEVTAWAPYELDQVLEGRLARSLTHRATSSLYVFSHETLREIAHQQLGATVDAYRGHLHSWAARYQDWPVNTPIYLMRGYPRMLAATGDFPRLLALATDRKRHERLLEYSGGDALAQIEITNATNLAAQQQDIGALLLLTVLRADLVDRNSRIPHELPAIWVKLGEPTRALALAQGIADHDGRAKALVAMAEAAYPDDRYRADRRVLDKVEREIKKCEDPYLRDCTVALLAAAAAKGGWPDKASRLAGEVGHHDRRLEAETACAIAVGDLERAARTANEIGYSRRRAEALLKVLQAATGPAPDLVAATEGAIFDHDREVGVPLDLLVELATVVGKRGDHDRRDELIKTARDLGANIDLPTRVRGALAEGLHDEARQLTAKADRQAAPARERFQDDWQDTPAELVWQATAELVQALTMVGDFDRAEQLGMTIAGLYTGDRALAELVRALAAAGHHDRAERLAGTISNLVDRVQAMTWVAATLPGEQARRLVTTAERHARQTAGSWWFGLVLADLVKPVAAAADPDCARRLALAVERLAEQVKPGAEKAYALCVVIGVVDTPLGREHAHRVAEQARDEARSSGDFEVSIAEREVVVSLARIGDVEKAGAYAIQCADTVEQLRVLAAAAKVLAKAGDLQAARRLVVVAEREFQRDKDIERRLLRPPMIDALLAIGDFDRAGLLAGNREPTVLAETAMALAAAGDLDRAHALALAAWEDVRSADEPRVQVPVAEALVTVGEHDTAVDFARHTKVDMSGHSRAAVAERLAAAGNHAQAEELSAEIRDEWLRSSTLAKVAGFAPEDVARRLVIEVLTSEHWQPAVSPAARLIGPQVVEIAEYLLG